MQNLLLFLQDRAEKVLLVNKIVCGIIDAACLSNIMNGETKNDGVFMIPSDAHKRRFCVMQTPKRVRRSRVAISIIPCCKHQNKVIYYYEFNVCWDGCADHFLPLQSAEIMKCFVSKTGHKSTKRLWNGVLLWVWASACTKRACPVTYRVAPKTQLFSVQITASASGAIQLSGWRGFNCFSCCGKKTCEIHTIKKLINDKRQEDNYKPSDLFSIETFRFFEKILKF